MRFLPHLRRYILVCDPRSQWPGLLRFETRNMDIQIEATQELEILRDIDWVLRRQSDYERGRFCELVFIAVPSGVELEVARWLAGYLGRETPPVGIAMDKPQAETADDFRRLGSAAVYCGLSDLSKLVQAIEVLRRRPATSPLGLEQVIQASLPWSD